MSYARWHLLVSSQTLHLKSKMSVSSFLNSHPLKHDWDPKTVIPALGRQCSIHNLTSSFRNSDKKILNPNTLPFPSLKRKKRIHFKKRAAWASNRQLLEIMKWTADFCNAKQTVLQNTVFMPVLAKVSWQIGQLAFRITTADETDQLQASHFPCMVTPHTLTPCRKHTA